MSFIPSTLRDRPFNLQGGGYGFFRTTQELEYLFSQNLTLGYMTKTLNQIFFFPSTKIRIFFSATLGIRMFFIESKKMTEKKISIGKKGYGCK